MHRLVTAWIMLALMAQVSLAEGAFNVGDRVWIISDINLKVREDPGTSSNAIDSVIKGTMGTIEEGPINKDSFNWWKIDYDIGTTGWSAENWLDLVSTEGARPSSDFAQWSENAIKWGENYADIGSKDWWDPVNEIGYGLRFVANAFMLEKAEGETGSESAIEAAKNLYRFDQEPDGWENAPRGAIIFFDKEGNNDYGHVGIYLGDGKLIHAYGSVQETTVEEAMDKPDVGRYLGWAYPPEDWRPKTIYTSIFNQSKQEPALPAEPASSTEPVSYAVAQPAIKDERTNGIDVSDYQGSINWSQVADAGYKFAFIKATEGEGFTGDPKARQQNFEANMQGASSAGMFVGVYHFARPDLGNSARDEARWFVGVAGDYIKTGDLRPVLDIEKGADVIGEANLSRWVSEWMETVKTETGVEPVIYTSSDFATNYLDASLTQYDLWVAHWTYDINQSPDTGIWDHWDFWQYSDSGNVTGIEGNVDLDIFNGNESELSNFIINPSIEDAVSENAQLQSNKEAPQVPAPQVSEQVRVNGYWDNSLADCTPGDVSATCPSVDDCVDCSGDCVPSGTDRGEGWTCEKGKWNFQPKSLSDLGTYRTTFDQVLYDNDTFMKIGNIAYNKGVQLHRGGEGILDFLGHEESYFAYFNLNGKYSRLTGFVGLDDKTENGVGNVTVVFGGDERDIQTVLLRPGDLPVEVDIYVSGIQRLTVETPYSTESAYIDLIDMALLDEDS